MKKIIILKFIIILSLQFMATSSYSQVLTSEAVAEAKAELMELVERVTNIYQPIFRKNFLRFRIRADFNDEIAYEIVERSKRWTSPASADFWPNRLAIVDIRGEVMALDHITKDVGALIICHEIGHLIGGAPLNKKLSFEGGHTTSEGQADYFSTLKCVKKLWKQDKILTIDREEDIPESLWNKCEQQFKTIKESSICKRTLRAINDLSKSTFYANSPDEKIIGPNHSSDEIASQTSDDYPENQCRIDILIAGALCNKGGDLSKVDPTLGSCSEENGDSVGVRPRCWYKPLSVQEVDNLKKRNLFKKILSVTRQ